MSGLVYIGNGAFLPGVPARDLTDEEVEQHGGADALTATGLYAAPPDVEQSTHRKMTRRAKDGN